MRKVPVDALQSFSYSPCIQEVVHEGLDQKSEAPLNHYHQNKLPPKTVVPQHPRIDRTYSWNQMTIIKSNEIKA